MERKNLLIIFVRNPVYGHVKTRLAASIGKENTLKVYQALLEHTEAVSREVGCDRAVYYDTYIDHKDLWKEEHFQKKMQQGNDLGERMLAAFTEGLGQGYQRIVLIGSDSFEITPDHIVQAFNDLETCEVVIGPSYDGGYYLIGMNRLYENLFGGIPWSTDKVFNETIQSAIRSNIHVKLLPMLNDVDIEEDIPQKLLTRIIEAG